MTSIAEAFATIRPDMSMFNAEAAQGIQRSMNQLGGQLTQAGRLMTVGITGPLVGMGAAALTAATRLGNAADALLDLQDITGVTTDTLQEFRAVTRLAGTEQDALGRAAEQLTRRMARGEEG